MSHKLFALAAAAALLAGCGDSRPPVAEGPIPAPGATSYVLYFDTGKWDLTQASNGKLDKAAERYRYGGISRITLTGHADTVGTQQANLDLSMRRAQSARAGLMSRGVPTEFIVVSAQGEDNLVVKTPDQTAEQRNRSVQITMK